MQSGDFTRWRSAPPPLATTSHVALLSNRFSAIGQRVPVSLRGKAEIKFAACPGDSGVAGCSRFR